jgi:hypothetical protein
VNHIRFEQSGVLTPRVSAGGPPSARSAAPRVSAGAVADVEFKHADHAATAQVLLHDGSLLQGSNVAAASKAVIAPRKDAASKSTGRSVCFYLAVVFGTCKRVMPQTVEPVSCV